MSPWLKLLAELGKAAGGALLDRIPVIRARRARKRQQAAIQHATETHHDPVAEAIAREKAAAEQQYHGGKP